ncbi:MAG: site-specific integrase, partial [Verrucomicrobiota bacterium]|nr:site-specific integrase [Verrucomicrobiota bacterium]
MTSDPFLEEFLKALAVERHASPRTIVNYRHALDTFRRQPDLPPWLKCDADHFRAHLFACMKERRARSTTRLHFAALRSFYRFLVERGRLKHNPLKEVLLPKPEKKLPLVLTATQIEELLSAPLR